MRTAYLQDHLVRTKARPIGVRQARVFKFCRAEVLAGRPFPRIVDIANHLGQNPHTGLYDCLWALDARGLIEATPREAHAEDRRRHVWRITAEGMTWEAP